MCVGLVVTPKPRASTSMGLTGHQANSVPEGGADKLRITQSLHPGGTCRVHTKPSPIPAVMPEDVYIHNLMTMEQGELVLVGIR